MNIYSKASVECGDGRPKDIEKAMKDAKVPEHAKVIEVSSVDRWVNGPSTSGNVHFVTLVFEWEKWVE